MKKSILMAIVALALLAAPAFAGDYSITANANFGWGWAIGANSEFGSGETNTFVNDFTMLGFSGSVDDFNTLNVQLEYGTSGSGVNVNGNEPDGNYNATDNDEDGSNTYGLRGLPIMVTSFTVQTDVLGALGVTGVPVTLSLTTGYGRAELHNRYQQWTGWEIGRWKGAGAAHFSGDYSGSGFNAGAWERTSYIKMQMGIMDMVNVAFAVCPVFGTTYDAVGDGDPADNAADIPFFVEAWTSGLVAGPAALDISANLRMDGGVTATGVQVTANMNFGALGLMAFVGEDYVTNSVSETADNAIYVAVKPSYNFGAGSVALGAWFGITSLNDEASASGEAVNIYDMAIDLALTYAAATLFGGVKMYDLGDAYESEESTRMKYEVGVKYGFGAVTLTLGLAGTIADADAVEAGSYAGDGSDIGAPDGAATVWNEANEDGEYKLLPTMYLGVSCWY